MAEVEQRPAPPSKATIIQVSVATQASGTHTTIIALCSDNSIWRIVNIGTGAMIGEWSAWEKIPSLALTASS